MFDRYDIVDQRDISNAMLRLEQARSENGTNYHKNDEASNLAPPVRPNLNDEWAELKWCPGPELNRYVSFETRDFKCCEPSCLAVDFKAFPTTWILREWQSLPVLTHASPPFSYETAMIFRDKSTNSGRADGIAWSAPGATPERIGEPRIRIRIRISLITAHRLRWDNKCSFERLMIQGI